MHPRPRPNALQGSALLADGMPLYAVPLTRTAVFIPVRGERSFFTGFQSVELNSRLKSDAPVSSQKANPTGRPLRFPMPRPPYVFHVNAPSDDPTLVL
ncbi:MAG TPA: hypothetical protein VFG54_00770 [Prolixibacteraceae bacterium]|nr:hypothetical protein [Prolixibacteraceae bacterium]